MCMHMCVYMYYEQKINEEWGDDDDDDDNDCVPHSAFNWRVSRWNDWTGERDR